MRFLFLLSGCGRRDKSQTSGNTQESEPEPRSESRFNSQLEIDDAAVVSEEPHHGSMFYNRIGRLPTYLTRTALDRLKGISINVPLMGLDIATQIVGDFRQMRLIIFEIARLGSTTSRIWGRRLKLTGPALALDKRICAACFQICEMAELDRVEWISGEDNERLKQNEKLKTAQGK